MSADIGALKEKVEHTANNTDRILDALEGQNEKNIAHDNVIKRVLFYEKAILALVGGTILATATGLVGKALAAIEVVFNK